MPSPARRLKTSHRSGMRAFTCHDGREIGGIFSVSASAIRFRSARRKSLSFLSAILHLLLGLPGSDRSRPSGRGRCCEFAAVEDCPPASNSPASGSDRTCDRGSGRRKRSARGSRGLAYRCDRRVRRRWHVRRRCSCSTVPRDRRSRGRAIAEPVGASPLHQIGRDLQHARSDRRACPY